MFGLPMVMIWPKIQEIFGDVCADEDMHNMSFTITAEGLMVEFPAGDNFLITPDMGHDELMKKVEEIGLFSK